MFTFVKSRLAHRKFGTFSEKGMEWLLLHRSDFTIKKTSSADIPWQVKPLLELIFLLVVLKRNGHTSTQITQMTHFAIHAAREFDWHQLAAFDPSAAGPIALLLQFFQLECEPAPFEEAHFKLLISTQFFEGMDRLPFRQMDYVYSMLSAGVQDVDTSLAKLFADTAFGRAQHLARYSIDDIYSITHALFYLTDVGLQPTTPSLDEVTRERLYGDVLSLTAMMVRGGNVDVLGELLICWLMCDFDRTDIFYQAMQFLEPFIGIDGSLAPTLRILDKSKNGTATFADLYHTTLVSVLLFTLLTKATE